MTDDFASETPFLYHGLTREVLAAHLDQTLLAPTAGMEAAEKWMIKSAKCGFATLCVSPFLVPMTFQALIGVPTSVCSVVGFPNGTSDSMTKCFEAVQLAKNGCSEIDIVMNVGQFLEGDEQYIAKEIVDIMKCVDNVSDEQVLFKVILETAYLTSAQICSATDLLSQTGIDFVKTSTGFAPRGASIEDIRLMCSCAYEGVGVKASGGIRDLATAIEMIEAGAERIGTSAGIGILAEFDALAEAASSVTDVRPETFG